MIYLSLQKERKSLTFKKALIKKLKTMKSEMSKDIVSR